VEKIGKCWLNVGGGGGNRNAESGGIM